VKIRVPIVSRETSPPYQQVRALIELRDSIPAPKGLCLRFFGKDSRLCHHLVSFMSQDSMYEVSVVAFGSYALLGWEPLLGSSMSSTVYDGGPRERNGPLISHPFLGIIPAESFLDRWDMLKDGKPYGAHEVKDPSARVPSDHIVSPQESERIRRQNNQDQYEKLIRHFNEELIRYGSQGGVVRFSSRDLAATFDELVMNQVIDLYKEFWQVKCDFTGMFLEVTLRPKKTDPVEDPEKFQSKDAGPSL